MTKKELEKRVVDLEETVTRLQAQIVDLSLSRPMYILYPPLPPATNPVPLNPNPWATWPINICDANAMR